MFDLELNQQFLKRMNPRPLYGAMWEPFLEPAVSLRGNLPAGTELTATDAEPSWMIDTAELIKPYVEALVTDLPFAYQACGGHQWMEAIMGCRSVFVPNSIYACRKSGATLESFLEETGDAQWIAALIKCHSEMARWAGSNRFCAIPLLHGPLDILVAYAGAEEVAYSIFDAPELLERCLDHAAEIFIKIAKWLLAPMQSVQGGYASRMHIFTTMPSVTMQNDASYLFSSPVFETFLVPSEKKVLSELSCVVYHMHNTSLWHACRVAELGYAAVQISVDPNGPPLATQIEVYRQVQKSVPLMLSCWSLETMNELATQLDPNGLCLTYIPAPDVTPATDDLGFRELEVWNAYYLSRVNRR